MKIRNRSTGIPEARGPRRRRRLRVQPAGAARSRRSTDEFHFVQLSDTHWGFEGPPNPDAKGTLTKAIEAMNALSAAARLRRLHGRPHAHDGRRGETAGPHETVPRHRREAEGEDGPLYARRARRLPRPRRGLPGALRGAALLVRPQGRSLRRPRQRVRSGRRVGEAQLAWLKGDLRSGRPTRRSPSSRTARSSTSTPSGTGRRRTARPRSRFSSRIKHVTVFYGHIHQEHHHKTGHIEHHSAMSLMFPLPAPGSVPKRAPLPWDETQPYRGLGWRDVEAYPAKGTYRARGKAGQRRGRGTKLRSRGWLSMSRASPLASRCARARRPSPARGTRPSPGS